jgi:hypothetical protein
MTVRKAVVKRPVSSDVSLDSVVETCVTNFIIRLLREILKYSNKKKKNL